MYYPSLEEARALADSGDYRRVPVSRELLSDFITPIQALRVLRRASGHCFLLESAADSAGAGRYTFLGYDPALEVTCKDGVLQLRDQDTVRTEIRHRRLPEILRALPEAGRPGPGEVPGHGPDAL